MTGKAVKNVKDAAEPPDWTNKAVIATGLVQGTLRPGDLGKFSQMVDRSKSTLLANKENSEHYCWALDALLAKRQPARLSEVGECCH